MSSPLKIFTPVWGPKHQGLLRYALCTSLAWSKNFPVCEEAEWLLTTDSEESFSEAKKTIKSFFPKATAIPFIYPEISRPGVDSGMLLIKSLQETVNICLRENSPMLMATPDFVYGNGTIDTFQQIADEPGSCATIANIRVLPNIIPTLSKERSNSDLVGVAFEQLHPSWRESPKNLYRGGVRWRSTSPGIYAVEHFMPSPFYVNFTEDDKNHFREWHERRPPGFGLWDHVWPTHLLEDGRLRFIGGSDAALMIEITDEDKNVPPLNGPNDPPGKFFRNHFHNNVQHQFVSIFRGTI